MITASVDISGFNRGMAGFVDRLGIEAPKVLKKEMGELLKTIIKFTPAANTGKIEENVRSKFATIADKNNSWTASGSLGGKGDIEWYAADSRFLYGVAKEKDMRKADVSELDKLYWRITKSGHRLNLPIKGNQKQRALISQTIITKESTVKKLIAMKIKRRGRLKAGWLAAWDELSPEGGNRPPAFVMRHKQGARGYYISGLGVKNHPTFTIANTAAGAGSDHNKMDWVAQSALRTRAAAMKKNLLLFTKGKKQLSAYARGA